MKNYQVTIIGKPGNIGKGIITGFINAKKYAKEYISKNKNSTFFIELRDTESFMNIHHIF